MQIKVQNILQILKQNLEKLKHSGQIGVKYANFVNIEQLGLCSQPFIGKCSYCQR